MEKKSCVWRETYQAEEKKEVRHFNSLPFAFFITLRQEKREDGMKNKKGRDPG